MKTEKEIAKDKKEIESMKKGISWFMLEPQVTFPEFFLLGSGLVALTASHMMIFFMCFVLVMFVRLFTNNKLGYSWGKK